MNSTAKSVIKSVLYAPSGGKRERPAIAVELRVAHVLEVVARPGVPGAAEEAIHVAR